MKRSLSFCFLLTLVPLSACGLTGLGPAVTSLNSAADQRDITPRTKGGTLNITPSSKGGTLLKGAVIWPSEVAALTEPIFDLKVYAGDTLLAQGQTDDKAGFIIENAPVGTRLRVEAAVPGRPFVVLRSLLTTLDEPNQELRLDISMLTTAVAAVLAEPGSLTVAPERLLQADTVPLLASLTRVMTPYLDATSLSMPIENQASVQTALSEARTALARALSGS